MQSGVPEQLLIVAGGGTYPQLLLEGARQAGVQRISMLAVRGMASRRLAAQADNVCWCGIGELGRALDWAGQCGAKHAALVGLITPFALFRTRFDTLARELLRSLPVKNTHTVYGRVAELLAERGLTTIPSSTFMDDHLPAPGLLSRRAPDSREASDIELGLRTAMGVSNHDIGQTVVVKEGMILAVEAFEGTNEAIRRGGKLGGAGAVVVKVAKVGHDMRFDIPAIGSGTIPMLKRARISALAFQARRTILLDRAAVLAAADRLNIAIVSVDSGLPAAPVRLEAGQ